MTFHWTGLVGRAAEYAERVHEGDVRKGTGRPYFHAHLLEVATIVAMHGGDEVQVAAAFLHDTAEDHGGQRRLDEITEVFGPEVAEIVDHLSDSLVDTAAGDTKEDWKPRKARYVASLEDKPIRSLEVAAADKLHNASSILTDLDRLGDDLWSRFSERDPTEQLWYYSALAEVIARRLPDHPTARAFTDVVVALRARITTDANTNT